MSGPTPANDGGAPSGGRPASEATRLLEQALAALDAANAPAEIAAYVQTALDALNEYTSGK